MGQPDDELEIAIRACQAAAAKMSAKRSFRLRVLVQMVQYELEKERLAQASEAKNGHNDQSPGTH